MFMRNLLGTDGVADGNRAGWNCFSLFFSFFFFKLLLCFFYETVVCSVYFIQSGPLEYYGL